MATALVDWKETNPVFNGDTIQPLGWDDEDMDITNNDDPPLFRTRHFEFENLGTTIRVQEKTRNLSQSTGLALWTCSQILSGYLADNPELVRGQQVLELGAGLGLCGIVAHHLDADHVVVTDGDTDVLRNLKHNVNLNRRYKEDERVSCSQLIWGRTEDFSARYSVMMATDVFYAKECIEPLWRTVDNLLEPNGLFLLAFVPHHVSMAEVLEKARDFGFTWRRPKITESDDDDDDSTDEEEDDYGFGDMAFAYHVFHFWRYDDEYCS